MTDAPSPRCSSGTANLPDWEDPRVKIVYDMLCDEALNTPPNPEEHWEGWISRNIVAALCGGDAQAAPDAVAALKSLVEICDRFWDSPVRDQAAAYYAFIKGKDKIWSDARAALALSSTDRATPVPDVEIERLRAIAWAAQGLLNADSYVSSVPREQAVREADLKLRQALGTWQMHHTAASALPSTEGKSHD